jgi:hypothetical protein
MLVSCVVDVKYLAIFSKIPIITEDVRHVKFRDVESCHHQDALSDKLYIGRQGDLDQRQPNHELNSTDHTPNLGHRTNHQCLHHHADYQRRNHSYRGLLYHLLQLL